MTPSDSHRAHKIEPRPWNWSLCVSEPFSVGAVAEADRSPPGVRCKLELNNNHQLTQSNALPPDRGGAAVGFSQVPRYSPAPPCWYVPLHSALTVASWKSHRSSTTISAQLQLATLEQRKLVCSVASTLQASQHGRRQAATPSRRARTPVMRAEAALPPSGPAIRELRDQATDSHLLSRSASIGERRQLTGSLM